jgi:hypothetical protein
MSGFESESVSLIPLESLYKSVRISRLDSITDCVSWFIEAGN